MLKIDTVINIFLREMRMQKQVQPKASIQRFGDICVIEINPVTEESKLLNNVFKLCEECISNLPTHEKLKSILSEDDIILIETIIRRNEIFKNTPAPVTLKSLQTNENEITDKYCFNFVSLQELMHSLSKNEKVAADDSNELLKELAPILLAIGQVVAALNKGDLFSSMKLMPYKNIQYVSVKVTDPQDAVAQEGLHRLKSYLAFLLAYAIESKRFDIRNPNVFETMLDGLELKSNLDISILPEHINMLNDIIPVCLKEDFADIYKHGELINIPLLEEGKAPSQEFAERVGICAQLAMLRSVVRELKKFADANFSTENKNDI